VTAGRGAAAVGEGSTRPGAIQRSSIQYPGGLAARYRWSGTAGAADVFGISEADGKLIDLGRLGGGEADRLCRAELRVEGPAGAWTARFASAVFDDPEGVLWDGPGLLLIKYGFRLYALAARTGDLDWSYGAGTPLVAILASSRLDHVLLQSEIDTVALRADGTVAWRAVHDDVITTAQLVAGRLDLTTYAGAHVYLDARTGLPA
jgi:hypothetical protein